MKKIFTLLLLLVSFVFNLQAQCLFPPTGQHITWGSLTTNWAAGDFGTNQRITFDILAGETIYLTTCPTFTGLPLASNADMQFTLYASWQGNYVAYNDDNSTSCACCTPNNAPYLTYTATQSGTLQLVATKYNCLDDGSTFTMAAKKTPAGGGGTNYTISLNASGNGSVSGNGTYSVGQTATVTATPANGANFVNWTEGGNWASSLSSYSFTVTGDRSLTANFSGGGGGGTTYNVNVSSNNTSQGSASGGGTGLAAGSTVYINAVANNGYVFDHWEDNGSYYNTSAYSSLALLSNNHSFVAYFTAVQQNTPSTFKVEYLRQTTGLPTNKIFVPTTNLNDLGGKVFKVCADGSNLVTQVTLKINDNSINIYDIRIYTNGSVNEGGRFINIVRSSGIGTIQAIYQHPTYMNLNNEYKTDEIIIENSVTGVILGRLPIQIYRAPVLMVHGFMGSSSAFTQMNNYLQGFYPNPLLYVANYQQSAWKRFVENKTVVPIAIETLLNQALNANISVEKIDYVGHSMGGILGRIYLQESSYRYNINKMITLNTPHSGTPLANIGGDIITKGIDYLFDGIPITSTIVNYSAVSDLKVGSNEMKKLNGALLNIILYPLTLFQQNIP